MDIFRNDWNKIPEKMALNFEEQVKTTVRG
jgi:hypothetical protein